ncbi:hypothetical protein F2Q68_00042522 [Brassica cretica]|uniref:Uncharacterized protein n=1 Tax=Brassica cretica TaxID=69181 RepID=A0A8S9MS69_BRACR|nr:hypothetical protein F2Q68_00042522 [Brassica cretica]
MSVRIPMFSCSEPTRPKSPSDPNPQPPPITTPLSPGPYLLYPQPPPPYQPAAAGFLLSHRTLKISDSSRSHFLRFNV